MMRKIDKKIFFDQYRKFWVKLDQDKVAGIDLFIDQVNNDPYYFLTEQWAYVFATTQHETNATFFPVREAYWTSEAWRKKYLRYYPYYGRGYVQLTWKENYEYYGKKLNIPLVSDPDLALDPDISFFILTEGMKHGIFTGKKLDDYVNDSKMDYVNARRVINGTDKASTIAKAALRFKTILELACV